jgi:hypothetical protein
MARARKASILSLDDFFEFVDDSVITLFPDEPYFSLILGAGASRSAGIPLAGEMTALLWQVIAAYGFPIETKRGQSPTFAEAIATIAEYADEYEVQAFILRCIRRGSREPNLTHLIAANLACCRFWNPIVTTNFDDLTLAAFWDLPVNERYREPYVVYDPRTVVVSRIEVLEGVPVIIKAHGHHTQYGLGLLDHQLAALAPGVKRAMRWQPPPRLGYIVVGSSGSFTDGTIEALKDRRLTRGRPIFWFFRGEFTPPRRQSPLAQLAKTADVRFVRCDDADVLFIRLWQLLDGTGGSAWLLDEDDLFTPATVAEQIEANVGEREGAWAFNPASTLGDDPSPEQLRLALGVSALKEHVMPLLDAIDKWDDELLPHDCLPERHREAAPHAPEIYFDGPEAKEIGALRRAVTRRLPWTRRNRKLLRIALDASTDPLLSHTLLTAIDRIRTEGWDRQREKI